MLFLIGLEMGYKEIRLFSAFLNELHKQHDNIFHCRQHHHTMVAFNSIIINYMRSSRSACYHTARILHLPFNRSGSRVPRVVAWLNAAANFHAELAARRKTKESLVVLPLVVKGVDADRTTAVSVLIEGVERHFLSLPFVSFASCK